MTFHILCQVIYNYITMSALKKMECLIRTITDIAPLIGETIEDERKSIT